jgi:hypothetical protein
MLHQANPAALSASPKWVSNMASRPGPLQVAHMRLTAASHLLASSLLPGTCSREDATAYNVSG